MAICPNCGSNLPDGASFCNMCGGSVSPQRSQEPMQKPASPNAAASSQKNGNGSSGKIAAGIVVGFILLVSGVAFSFLPNGSLGSVGGETVVTSSSSAVSSSSSSSSTVPRRPSETVECEFSGLRYSVPSTWYEKKDEGGGYYYRVNYESGANFKVNTHDLESEYGITSVDEIDIDELRWAVATDLEESGAVDVETDVLDVNGYPAIRASFHWHNEGSDDDPIDEFRYEIDEYVLTGSSMVEFTGVCSFSEKSLWSQPFTNVIDSIHAV